MFRLFVAALSVLAAGTVFTAAQQEPQFRGGTHMVSVYATVVDQYGRLIPNLTKDDFEILDNGRRQPVTVFANDVRPITIVMMLDRSGSMVSNFTLVRDAAEHFVGHLLPADRARIGSFSNEVRIEPASFTSSREELVDILRNGLQPAGATPLWAATSRAMDALAREEGRRVVLLFTDGKDNPTQAYVGSTFADVRARSQIEEIMVYGIGLSERCDGPAADPTTEPGVWFQRGGQRGGPRSGPAGPMRGLPPQRPGGGVRLPPRPGGIGRPPIGRPPIGPRELPPPPPPAWPTEKPPSNAGSCVGTGPDPDLKELSGVGGGGYFELTGTADLQATFARVANELHHQYLLAFPSQALDGRLHTLQVKVDIPGLTARARKSYFATPK